MSDGLENDAKATDENGPLLVGVMVGLKISGENIDEPLLTGLVVENVDEPLFTGLVVGLKVSGENVDKPLLAKSVVGLQVPNENVPLLAGVMVENIDEPLLTWLVVGSQFPSATSNGLRNGKITEPLLTGLGVDLQASDKNVPLLTR